MTQTDHDPTPRAIEAPARDFIVWMLRALGLSVHDDVATGVHQIGLQKAVDEAELVDHPCAAVIGKRFAFESSPMPQNAGTESAEAEPVELLTWHSPLMQWLLKQVAPGQRVLHATAARQPLSVHELADHLFAQYQVDGGHIQLAGCCLEDRPFLRLSYIEAADEAVTRFVHCFGTDEGELLDGSVRNELELDELVPTDHHAPRMQASLVQQWKDLIQRQYETQLDDQQDRSLAAMTLVWCKYAEGKLAFSIGKRVVELPFSGWGQMLASHRELPPPYSCPLTGRASYHLAATDDGRITVAEAIGVCAESSRRVLEDELSECAVTKRKVLPEYLQECPCMGEQVLRSELQRCGMCQQQVSPEALQGGQCLACRSLQAISPDDSRLGQLLERMPRLARLRNIKWAETSAAHVMMGNTTWKRLLVVLGKPQGEVVHAAIAGRLSSRWIPLTDAQHEQWLGEQ